METNPELKAKITEIIDSKFDLLERGWDGNHTIYRTESEPDEIADEIVTWIITYYNMLHAF